ncbi:flavodoxin domain-containing protein [Clostridium gasigenes]|uniref:flavodoxin domain-containing protein n=1 Tax=Clostridium gasigenes TaxID=94869 RepID=UPI001C0C8248|nr:flavodoxin domain-containing protein [Clostridium gasigenes]MBU3132613.1 flavodoxin domain-containing protein [Clostridium gasigenes]
MKAIVIYKSKTGFTKRYAEWICEELKCEISNYRNLNLSSLDNYDFVIYGSRIHAGKVDGLKNMKKMFVNNEGAKLIVFATGATPFEAKDNIDKIWKANFSEQELKTIPHFYTQSGLNYEKMGIGDRLIMKSLAKMLSSKNKKSKEESGCEEAIVKSHDISSREYIEPLVRFIKNSSINSNLTSRFR